MQRVFCTKSVVQPIPEVNMSSTATTRKAVRVRPVPAVSRAIAILRLLGESEQPLGVKAIADALGLVPSTALHILRVLVSEELIEVDTDTKRYALGGGMITLARSVLEKGSLAQRAQPSLDRIASGFGLTAMFVEITAQESVVVLGISHSAQPFRIHTDVGSQFNTLVSATGRLIAAYSQSPWSNLRQKFDAVAWDRRPSFSDWKREVEMAREQGWSIDRDNFLTGITVLAVPVLTPSGRMSHTLVAAGLSSQFDQPFTNDLAQFMCAEASALSRMTLG